MDQLDRSFNLDLEWIKRFGRALLRHIPLIIAVAVVAGVAGAALGLSAAPLYQAESWLLMKPATLTTLGDQYNNDVDAASRLISSPALEARVLRNAKINALPANLRHPGALLPAIDVKTDIPAHVIKIVASLDKPADAALLSNVWAEEAIAFLKEYYIAYVDVYGAALAPTSPSATAQSTGDGGQQSGSTGQQTQIFLREYYPSDLAALAKQQADAKAHYDQAQKAYQDYLLTDPIPGLQAQIDALGKAQATPQAADGDSARRNGELNRQLEVATADKQQLLATRDLYWSSYVDLSKRLADATTGLSGLNRVEQIVTASADVARQKTTRQQIILSNAASAFLQVLGIMVLVVLLYEVVAPGKNLFRELVALPRRGRGAASPQ